MTTPPEKMIFNSYKDAYPNPEVQRYHEFEARKRGMSPETFHQMITKLNDFSGDRMTWMNLYLDTRFDRETWFLWVLWAIKEKKFSDNFTEQELLEWANDLGALTQCGYEALQRIRGANDGKPQKKPRGKRGKPVSKGGRNPAMPERKALVKYLLDQGKGGAKIEAMLSKFQEDLNYEGDGIDLEIILDRIYNDIKYLKGSPEFCHNSVTIERFKKWLDKQSA